MDFDMNNLLQQAQQMQEKMKKAQEEAANAEVTGEAGAGLVKVVMNGRRVESSQKDMMKGMTDGFPFPPGFKP